MSRVHVILTASPNKFIKEKSFCLLRFRRKSMMYIRIIRSLFDEVGKDYATARDELLKDGNQRYWKMAARI